MKNAVNAVVFAVAIVAASIFLGNAYVDRSRKEGKIQVTGLGKADFTADFIVWEGEFRATAINLKQAYLVLNSDKELIRDYLSSKGVAAKDVVFNAVKTEQITRSTYTSEGHYSGDVFVGYQLVQSVQIRSEEVNKVELISREITELLNSGVKFYSEAPRYYYTRLADLKIEMISKATEDARVRAEQIAQFSGGQLGEVVSAKMGVFQITGKYSKEDYSWGGTLNTSSKEKTASITMKLEYKVR